VGTWAWAFGVTPRLRDALRAGGWTNERLAHAVGVDPKTVDRWLNRGRTPHRNTATHTAAVLGLDPLDLWPGLHRPTTRTPSPGVCRVWARRTDAPTALWWDLFTGARREIDVLCRTGMFLHEQLPGLPALLTDKARQGCTIRLAISDPRPLPDRDADQDPFDPEDIPALHQASLDRFASLTDRPGISLRTHSTTTDTDLYRADDDLLLLHRLPGLPTARAPLWHLHNARGGLFDTHLTSFERLWAYAHHLTDAC
jgi:transcriptional regulator with XRE-family HTH domain